MDNHAREEDKRAKELRSAFRVLRSTPRQRQAHLQNHSLPPLPRFSSSGANIEQAPLENAIVHFRLGVAIEARISLRGEPFAQLVSKKEETVLGRWPMFPVIGGENGPATIEHKDYSVQISGGQGKLELTFNRHEASAPKGLFSRVLHWFKSLKRERVPEQSTVVALECRRSAHSRGEFSVRATSGWKVAS